MIKHFSSERDVHMHENLQIKHYVNFRNGSQWLENLKIKQEWLIFESLFYLKVFGSMMTSREIHNMF